MLFAFYQILTYLFLPLALLRLIFRARKNSKYLNRLSERWGNINCPEYYKHGIWVHAVSFGEAVVAISLAQALIKAFPNLPIIITSMTLTGSEYLQKNLNQNIFHGYAPYDQPSAVKRFLKNIQPKLCILMETELWPNLIYYTHQLQIPILMANARLSSKSERGYKKWKSIVCPMLSQINFIAAQSLEDQARFLNLGVLPDKIKVLGNIKFDFLLSAEKISAGKILRERIRKNKKNKFIWVAASTHEGEEKIILQAFAKIREVMPDLVLIIVPRHPERFNRVFDLCQSQSKNYNIVRQTELTKQDKHENRENHKQACVPNFADIDILLGDTMGELISYYAAADIAFVGGSLISHGGHNLLEPAALSLPIITGQHLFNFNYIAELLLKAEGLIIINNAAELAEKIIALFSDKWLCETLGKAAYEVVAQNKGALQRHIHFIRLFLARIFSLSAKIAQSANDGLRRNIKN